MSAIVMASCDSSFDEKISVHGRVDSRSSAVNQSTGWYQFSFLNPPYSVNNNYSTGQNVPISFRLDGVNLGQGGPSWSGVKIILRELISSQSWVVYDGAPDDLDQVYTSSGTVYTKNWTANYSGAFRFEIYMTMIDGEYYDNTDYTLKSCFFSVNNWGGRSCSGAIYSSGY